MKELEQYDIGFIDGKWRAINVFKLGKFVRFQTGEEVPKNINYWYELGFLDGFGYFNDLILDNKLCLKKIDTKKIKCELFYKRFVELSKKPEQENSKVKVKK